MGCGSPDHTGAAALASAASAARPEKIRGHADDRQLDRHFISRADRLLAQCDFVRRTLNASASESLLVRGSSEVVVGDVGDEALSLALFVADDSDITVHGVTIDRLFTASPGSPLAITAPRTGFSSGSDT